MAHRIAEDQQLRALLVTINTAPREYRGLDLTEDSFGGDELLFDSFAGQDALNDIVAVLDAEANGDLDAEDLAHYRSLLAAPPAAEVDLTQVRELVAA